MAHRCLVQAAGREVLADGTYLSALTAPRALRWAGATDITVRVVEYRFDDEAG
jgi:hypothetical protein